VGDSRIRLAHVEAWALRIPRDLAASRGTAGSPVALKGSRRYRRAATYPAVYSDSLETVLVKVTSDAGLVGWGEVQAPVAPEVPATIVNAFLSELVAGVELEPGGQGIQQVWQSCYDAMRVRGHFGGFFLDALSGLDLALWDLVGKVLEVTVAELLNPQWTPAATISLPAYISGLPARQPLAYAREFEQRGFRAFKLFHSGAEPELLDLVDRLRTELEPGCRLAVDGLWRFSVKDAIRFGWELDKRAIWFFESPMLPEDVEGHRALARAITTPLAVGEAYRSWFELERFFYPPCLGFVQPDFGRSGLTGTFEITSQALQLGVQVIPHTSITLGTQWAAALHFGSATRQFGVIELNPAVLEVANRFVQPHFTLARGHLALPAAPGFGLDFKEEELCTWRVA